LNKFVGKNSNLVVPYLITAIVFISMSLRAPVAVIGPLLNQIQASMHLDAFQVGLLSALPVFCFGIGAFVSSALVARTGIHKAMTITLLLLLTGSIARLFGGFSGLLFGTLVVGFAIAIANVLLPTVVRVYFANRVGFVTGIYTTTLAVSASVAATTAVSLALLLQSWSYVPIVWLAPTVLAIWLWQRSRSSNAGEASHAPLKSEISSELRTVRNSAISWSIVGFFGLQSTGFYAVLNWLPTLLVSRGVSSLDAGALLGLTTIAGVPIGFLLSGLFRKFNSLSVLAAAISLVTILGFTALTVFPQMPVLGCVLLGIGQASSFPLSLTFIAAKAKSVASTTYLSTLAQGWGYLLAGFGTFAVGYLAISTSNWTISLVTLIGLTFVQLVLGIVAGKPGQIK
jgi:CP family cyanate transporter-like MFS transporter